MVIKRCLGKAVTLAAMALALAVPARGDGFRGGVREVLGPRFEAAREEVLPRIRARRGGASAIARLRYWNAIAIDTSGLDHTPLAAGETRIFGEQVGPGRSSRAMAIVHIAMFEAVNAVAGGYQSFVGLPFEGARSSMDSAIAQAAHDTLAVLFPSQAAAFDALLAEDLGRIREGRAKTAGIDLGRRAAFAILSLRNNDGSQHSEARLGTGFAVSGSPGKWRQDPISLIPLALGSHWGKVTPFVLESPGQFRVPPPPAMETAEYAAAYDEVQRLGGDGVTTATERTADQTMAGIYWAYDGTPTLCAPPRLYNQIALVIAEQKGSSIDDAGAIARAGQRGHGGRGNGDLGVEVPLPGLAAGHRNPRVGPRHRSDRARGRQPGHAGRPDLHAARRPGEQPHGPQLHAAVPGLSIRACRVRRRPLPDPAAFLWP